MKTIIRLTFASTFICIIGLSIFSSCTVIQQLKEVQNFASCEFRLSSVQNITLAGVNIQRIKSRSDLSLTDAAKFAIALSQNQLPLNLTLNVELKNPNKETASLNRLEWRAFIDELEIVSGLLDNKISIPGNDGIGVLPLQLSADLKKVLTGRSGEAIGNFALNLAGEGNKPTRFMLRVKPSIDVLGVPIEYPDYFDVKLEFTSGMAKNIRNGIVK